MKKGFLLTLLIVCCSIWFVGCNETKKVVQLDTPQNLVVENQYISFNEVENASYYCIYYNGNTFNVKPSNTGEIVVNGSKIFTESKIYEIKVKAVGEGKYIDSEYSESFEYLMKYRLNAPTIKLNNQTIFWDKVENASYYTIKLTYPDNSKGYYTYSDRTFNFSSLLNQVGKYTFQVKSGNIDDDNVYSNEIEFYYSKKLATPDGVKLYYDNNAEKLFLYCLIDENSGSYLINVNNAEYTLTAFDVEKYVEITEFKNLIKINLTDFLETQGEEWKNVREFDVSIQSLANVNNGYEKSDVSTKTNYKVNKVLNSPILSISENGGTTLLSWTKVDNVLDYVIYKNYEFYTTVKNDVNSIMFNTENIQNVTFVVQAEGIDGFVNSAYSNPVGLIQSNTSTININFDNGVLTWTEIENAKYILEVYNESVRHCFVLNENRFDLNDNVQFGNYNVKVTVIVGNEFPIVKQTAINFIKTLDEVENAKLITENLTYSLTFDKVDYACGYAIKLNDVIIDKIFDSNTIDLTPYLVANGQYLVAVQTISYANGNILNSEFKSVGNVQHITQLQAPTPNVELINGKYILKFDEVENAVNYTILVNYISIYGNGIEYVSDGYDITSHLTSAQKYTVMVRANADKDNKNFISSDFGTTSVLKYIQLNTINKDDIKIEREDDKYYINFTTQTQAANYDIRIYNVETDTENKFNITARQLPYEIPIQYIKNNGTYQIYVRAMASTSDNYLYLSAPESGNPYVLNKDKPSLLGVKNIKISEKVAGNNSIKLSWDEADFANKYYIIISFSPTTRTDLKTIVVEELTITSNYLDIAKYLTKEGIYTIKIKSLGNEHYEPSVFVTYSYNYEMTVDVDFMRNEVFMNGETFSHYITSYKQLKHLLWYYYLYNDETYYQSSQLSYYKLKAMFGISIDSLNAQCVQENSEFENVGENFIDKLYEISKIAINSYNENIYLRNNSLSKPIEVTEDLNTFYLFDYYDGLNSDKTEKYEVEQEFLNYNSKIDLLPLSSRRNENYIFALDLKEKVDVTTSEQLFMAVQFGKSPNFVGNCLVAENIYYNCRAVLKTICNDSMTDYEKVCAIYDWLVKNVEYNEAIEILKNSISNIGSYVDMDNTIRYGNLVYDYLESVFLNDTPSATSNGLSKAFVLMCQLEGINAIKVNGRKANKAYYWNKVFIDANTNDENENKNWFSLDISGSKQILPILTNSYQIPTHQYFLTTDVYLKSKLGIVEEYLPVDAVSNTSFNYLANTEYRYNKKLVVVEDGKIVTKTFSGYGMLQYTTSFGTTENYVIDVMKYLALQSDNQYNVTVEIDLSYSSTTIESIASNVNSVYYNTVSKTLGMTFRVQTQIYDNVLIIAIQPN